MKRVAERSRAGGVRALLLGVALAGALPAVAQEGRPATLAELRQRAEAGHGWSQLYLGAAYHNGANGAPRDVARAVHWYKAAAEQGIPFAQYNLGVMYGEGSGVERDERIAFEWLSKAASFLAEAKYLVGRAYAEGRGTERSTVKARQFLEQAAAGGSENARSYIRTLP